MIIQCTKSLLKKVNPVQEQMLTEEPEAYWATSEGFYAWHASEFEVNGRNILFFMNNQTRLALLIVCPQREDYEHLGEVLEKEITVFLKRQRIHPDVIRKYLVHGGDTRYSETAGKRAAAQMNRIGAMLANEMTWQMKMAERTGQPIRDYDLQEIVPRIAANNAYFPATAYDLPGGTGGQDASPEMEMYRALCRMTGDATEAADVITADVSAVDAGAAEMDAAAAYEKIRDRRSYILHIRLDMKRHEIWRRVEVPARYTLINLEGVIRIIFGWIWEGKWEFRREEGDYHFIHADPACPGTIPDSHKWYRPREMELPELFDKSNCWQFAYDYIFTEGICHIITVEEYKAEGGCERPRVLQSKGDSPRGCPSEESYEEELKILSDPEHPSYEFRKKIEKASGFKNESIEEINSHLWDLDAEM